LLNIRENGGVAPLNLTIDGGDHFHAMPSLVPVKGPVVLTGLAPDVVAKRNTFLFQELNHSLPVHSLVNFGLYLVKYHSEIFLK
jgi:hypothetical protein